MLTASWNTEVRMLSDVEKGIRHSSQYMLGKHFKTIRESHNKKPTKLNFIMLISSMVYGP